MGICIGGILHSVFEGGVRMRSTGFCIGVRGGCIRRSDFVLCHGGMRRLDFTSVSEVGAY